MSAPPFDRVLTPDKKASTDSLSRIAVAAVSPKIDKVRRHLEAHFATAISLKELATFADMNVFTLIKMFRAQIGVTPHQYICQLRVREAQSLLRGGATPALAAMECGFFDQSHLARHFKRECGVTPRRYAESVASRRAGL